MARVSTTQRVPLSTSKSGDIRIAGSRVGLEAIIHEFKNGATAEQIQQDFPSVSLPDIYAVIAYYLDNKVELESYLRRQQKAAARVRRYIEARVDTRALRQKLRNKRSIPIK